MRFKAKQKTNNLNAITKSESEGDRETKLKFQIQQTTNIYNHVKTNRKRTNAEN